MSLILLVLILFRWMLLMLIRELRIGRESKELSLYTYPQTSSLDQAMQQRL